MKQPISITALASLSALGSKSPTIWSSYLTEKHCISIRKINGKDTFVAQLSDEDKQEIEALKKSDNKYKSLDETVLYAILVSRKAVKIAGWRANENFGVNFGSSRGATNLFEKYHAEFLKEGVSSTLSSPTTTLGNISSWVAHDLQTNGPEISHSITCSTALHSILNGIAWINSGMSSKFLVGGSEAPLTEFTIAQMQALKVYAKRHLEIVSGSHDLKSRLFDSAQGNKIEYPCKALDLEKTKNTMVLGEGAAVICLEAGNKENAIAKIIGIGFATEVLKHNTSVTADAKCFQKSIQMAIGEIKLNDIDAIVMHAPGTVKGDISEVNAIKKVFGENYPFLTTNKWKLGHTFGASGMLNIELAILMLQHQKVIEVPFSKSQKKPKQLNKILVNAVGFGGNAVSILLSK